MTLAMERFFKSAVCHKCACLVGGCSKVQLYVEKTKIDGRSYVQAAAVACYEMHFLNFYPPFCFELERLEAQDGR